MKITLYHGEIKLAIREYLKAKGVTAESIYLYADDSSILVRTIAEAESIKIEAKANEPTKNRR